ncbi:hypothetical protein [Agaribacter flavus]|uniref:Solute-binding protein family 3/N-terminal domain-containing protein n=1 Tax=Agaribacter flavus TaxID=1902781 RepID=A0ABV7FR80_9ALTE
MGKFIAVCLVVAGSVGFAWAKSALNLVGNTVPTLISENGKPARLIELASAGFIYSKVNITATKPVWAGAGLRSNKFNGYIDHYSLDQPRIDYVYSQPYANIQLYIASVDSSAKTIERLEQVVDERIGIERRFANTDKLRVERTVKWSRADDFYHNILQIAEQRVSYILADKVMLDEMNKLLAANGEEPLSISVRPIFEVGISIGLKTNVKNADKILSDFDNNIAKLIDSSEHSRIYFPKPGSPSLLDSAIYENVIRKW